jgi:hypothetical protein
MRHILLRNGEPTNYTIEQLLLDVPDAQIYQNAQMPNEALLAAYNVYPLVTTAPPLLREDEAVEEGTPEFKDGEWYQTWSVRTLTEAEIQQIIDSEPTPKPLRAGADPTEVFAASMYLADSQAQEARYDICKDCTAFTILKTCKECGCIMPLKVKIANASCPLGKW